MEKVFRSFLDNIDKDSAKSYAFILSKIISNEFVHIGSPCYIPSIKKNTELFNKIADKETINNFLGQFSKKYRTFDMFSDKSNIILIMLFVRFLELRLIKESENLLLYLVVKFYSSLVSKHFPKGCNNETWEKSFITMYKGHLFIKRNGMVNAFVYIFYEVYDKYDLKKLPIIDYDLVKFFYELRHRMSQSFKSFAENYYYIMNNPGIILSQIERFDLEDEISEKVEELVNLIVIYNVRLDDSVIESIIKKVGISNKKEYLKLIDRLENIINKNNLIYFYKYVIYYYSNKNYMNLCNNNVFRSILKDYDKFRDMLGEIVKKKLDKKEILGLIYYLLIFYNEKIC